MGDEHEHVEKPKAPQSTNIFLWDNQELQKWVNSATKMQNQHVIDNNNTKYFKYKQTELDAIQLRICMSLFGMKNPVNEKSRGTGVPKGTPKSLLKAYSWHERRRARELQAKISKDSNPKDCVYINYIFISAAFPSAESFNASENIVFVFHESRNYMDAGGRVYQSWSDYLRNNHLDQAMMIFPEDGSYTPSNSDGSPKKKVSLIASETQSCKPSARAKDLLDKAVVTTGLLLAGAAVVTAVPLGIFAASTIATISTGSYYIGLACTAYSVATNGYDKLRHDESVITEVLLVGTTALSGLTSYMNQYWSKRMADIVQKTDVWDDVARSITRSQKFVFATLNLVKVAMSASSVFSAFWHLCMKQNRTWLDYYQLSISLFFFANVVTKPIFLQQVFEAERIRFAENYVKSVDEIREKVQREEAKQEFDKAVENAKTNAQKTYLIRNLQKIQDLDGHFYRIHETGSMVNYTEKGLVINNQITLSPEAYNQMGKEQLLQQLDDIKHYPTQQERQRFVQKLLEDYNSPDFEGYASNYVEGTMTPEQQADFDRKISEMAVRRKDQFFSDTTNFKETPQYRDMVKATENEIAGGQNVEVLNQEKKQLDADRAAGSIEEQEHQARTNEINQNMEKAKHAREIRKSLDKYVQNSSSTRESIGDDYVKQQANGKTEQEWQRTRNNIQAKFDSLPEDVQRQQNVQERFQKQLNDATTKEQMAIQARQEINSQLDKPWVKETRNLYMIKDNYERNEDFIWHVTNDNTKSSIEEIWGVTDYREATVNGKQIFKGLDTNTIDDMNCIINSCGKNTAEVVKLAKQLAEDRNCQMKADNAREFGHVVNAVRQSSGHLGSTNYNQIRDEVNRMYESAAQAVMHDNQVQYSSINSAAVHSYKHKEELGPGTTTNDYLTTHRDTLIRPENATGSVYTQDGSGISTNYRLTDSGRYRFGTIRTDLNGQNPYIKTMHVRSEAGVGQQPTANAANGNQNAPNPGGANTTTNTMTLDYTQESLQLTIIETVYTKDAVFSVDELLTHIFGASDNTTTSNTLKSFVRRQYINQLKGFIRYAGKKHIYEQLKIGSTVFIKRFEQQTTLHNLFGDVPRIQMRINCLVAEKGEGSLYNEFSRYFAHLRNRFVPLQAEENFRLSLIEWFRSGEMTKMIRHEIIDWFKDGAKLNKFKKMNFSSAQARDSFKLKVIKAVQAIHTDEFMQIDILNQILSKFLAPTTMNIEAERIRLRGRSIFLSDWIEPIMKKCTDNPRFDVEIYAVDCCGIDCNVNLYGINVVISSNKVYVWQKHNIVLSGLTFQPGKSKAASAKNSTEQGTNGTDGCPGYSSGNFHLYAKEMINPSWLSVHLNGGRGQDGGDGGDGYDGKDGVGIDQNELDRLCVKYSSLYFNYWSTFHDYAPGSPWVRTPTCKWDNSKQYGYEEYEDEHKRKLTYSYAGDVGWVYTTYHLYFMIEGSAGTSGTQGGSNGVGGEGGYRGNAVVENPETGESFSINIERNMGQNGINGTVGKSGRFGNVGNDMVIIDRSVSGGGEKHYIGSSTTKLSISYDYEAETYNRLNGYRKHVDGKSACFAKFSTRAVDRSERRAEAPGARTEHTRASKAVAKKHVIAEKVLSEANQFFEAEDVFLGDTSKQTTNDNAEDEEEETEASEAVTEEMVMLRQRDESKIVKYTPQSEKKMRSKITPQNLIKRIKTTGRFGMIGVVAQNLFDLFSIEISAHLLETVRFHTLFQKNFFRHRVTESKLSLAILTAQQDRLIDGKSFNEILAVAQDITIRRQRKYQFAQFNGQLQKFIHEFENSQCHPNLSIDMGAVKIYGVKKTELKIDLINVKKMTTDFFREFTKYRVNHELLRFFNDFYDRMDKKYGQKLAQFNETIDWTDKRSYEPYFNVLRAWLKEKEDASKNKGNMNDDNFAKKPIGHLRQKNDSEAQFEDFVSWLHGDRKYVEDSIGPLRHYIKHHKESTARFGEVPSFKEDQGIFNSITGSSSSENISKLIEPTLNIIRFYWLSHRILIYMRHLYTCNELFAIETGKLKHEGIYVDDGHHPNFVLFIDRAERQPLDIANEACQLHMEKYGMNCASVRYLMAYKLDVHYQSYIQSGYHLLTKKESFNGLSNKTEILWIDNWQVYAVAVDEQYRDLNQAQVDIVQKYSKLLNVEREAESKLDYLELNAREAFASFYGKSLQSAILQWIEGYLSLTNDQTLLQHLHHRFDIDGCHLTPFELQFILLSSTKLQSDNHCDIKFLLLLCSSVPQNEIINVLLYIQIIYHRAGRFHNTKIYDSIQLIESARHKALFAVKLNNYDKDIDENQIYKLILMLQHSSNGSEQLEKMGLDEWIDVANKQKWSEIGGLIRKYGEVGYYLGFLDDHGRQEEERMMRQVFDAVHYIPEILIAKICQFIVNKEVHADQVYFRKLQSILELGNNFTGLDVTSEKRPYLITSESEQQRFINYIYKQNATIYAELLPSQKRNIDGMLNLVIGLHDVTEESKLERQNEVKRIGDMVKNLQNKDKNNKTLTESMRLLLEYDDYLAALHKIRLRPTQQLAVLYSVESGKNVLEQVNTGEGKSYIIAAIAIIRRKIGYKHVDIITSSPVLAQRDADAMRSLYEKFHLTVGHNCEEDFEKRKKAYESDIVYGDIARFQRDYLLHTFYKKNILGDRTRDAVIVDEVDNMLLDNGNNMLYLSHDVVGLNLLDSLLIFIHKQVYLPIFNGMKTDLESMQAQFDDKRIKQTVLKDIFGQMTLDDLIKLKTHQMTMKNVEDAYNKLIQNEYIDTDGYLKVNSVNELSTLDKDFGSDAVFLIRLKNTLRIILGRQRSIEIPKCLRHFVKLHLDELIKNSKNAMFMKTNYEYVVDIDHSGSTSFIEPRITIIDSNTGADLATSQWSEGLHQFLQIKHGCRLSPISLKAVFISNVTFLKGYQKINGLSGTLGSSHESQTLIDLYKADLIKIPTFQPKIFYEHVPVIATNENDWLQSLFDEVCDQASAKRSVLIICESIAQVRLVHEGIRSRYQQTTRPSLDLQKCFESITIYEREFNEFNFNVGSEYQCSKLIIATNLAGRGTDIKLSQDLIRAGGLHVITAFLPINCRIEEQAFGRAARCGQPGSAQIISMRTADDDIQPSVFQLKMFRDNQEVHRLASLKSFYDYHTETEERCLEKFRNHSSQALGIIYSSKTSNTFDVLPTPAQVVYFALLDKWALWLDRSAPLINQCAKNHSKDDREAIIKSVDDFLQAHPISGGENCYETAKDWIDIPQSLITIGIIQMSHNDGFQAAEDTFNRILADGYEFAAEVYYFKACMRMCQWNETRTTLNSIKIATPEAFKKDIEYAIEYFHKSRKLFRNRVQRRQREAKIVVQYLDASAPNHVKTCGFTEQQKAMTTTYELIIANIDWILGVPCRPDMFVTKVIPKDYAEEVYDALVRQGVISPIVISKYPYEDWQLDPFRNNFKMSKKDVDDLIENIKNDSRAQSFGNDTELDISIMSAHVKLAHRIGFWMQLKKLNVFVHAKSNQKENEKMELEERIQHVVLVDGDNINKIPQWMKKLEPVPKPDLETSRYQIRLSNETEHGLMYNFDEIEKSCSQDCINEMEQLIELKVLKHDWIGQLNMKVLHHLGYLDTFDGITTDDIAHFFNIEATSAAWIIDLLIENGVLKRDTMAMHRFTKDEQLWDEKVTIHRNKEEKETSNLIAKHAENLTTIRNLPILKNITTGIIDYYCKMGDHDQLNTFFKLLKDEKLLEPIFFTKFRLYGKIDCFFLPSCIGNEIEEFLSDRLAYSFALEHLCLALDESKVNPTTPKKLFLPDHPQKEFYEELLSSGIGIESRISQEDYSFVDFNHYQYKDEILNVINNHRTKLWDQTHYHMEFVSFASYFSAQGNTIDSDTKAIIENGLSMVISKRDDSIGWSLQNATIKTVTAIGKSIWSGVKSVGNWFYSIGSSFCEFISPVVDYCVDAFDYVAEGAINIGAAIREKVVAVADAIAETEIVKMATQTVKDVANVVADVVVTVADVVVTVADVTGVTTAAKAIGHAAVATTNFIGDVAVTVGTAVSEAATAAGQYIADTRIFKAAKEAFATAMNVAKNLYQKMSSYVTASYESYLYYNQCRVTARRLAIEQNITNEHFILQNYDKAISYENRRQINDNMFEQKMREYMFETGECWLSQMKPVIQMIVQQRFNKINKHCNRVDVQSAIENGQVLRRLTNEVTEHLTVLANINKVVFFQLIKHYAVQRDANLSTLSLHELDLTKKKHNVEQIKETLMMTCEQIEETIENETFKTSSSDNLTSSIEEILHEHLKSLVHRVFIDPTIKLVSTFLEICRQRPQLATMFAFNEEDKNVKKAIADFNASTQTKKNAEFLFDELRRRIIEMLRLSPQNKTLLKFAIKSRFPLPTATIEPIANIVESMFAKKGFKSTGFWVSIYSDDQIESKGNEPIRRIKTNDKAKMDVHLRCFNDQFYLCGVDSLKNVDNESMSPYFFYENLISKMKNLRKCFPDHDVSFRRFLLENL